MPTSPLRASGTARSAASSNTDMDLAAPGRAAYGERKQSDMEIVIAAALVAAGLGGVGRGGAGGGGACGGGVVLGGGGRPPSPPPAGPAPTGPAAATAEPGES